MFKLFLNCSDEEDDRVMMNNLCLHFSVLKDKVDLWHKGKLLPGDDIQSVLSSNLADADAALHLLSLSYTARPDCMQLLEKGIELHKKNIPVLLTSFYWEGVEQLKVLEQDLLPEDRQPVDIHPNFNEVYTGIVKKVAKDHLKLQTRVRTSYRGWYLAWAGINILIGVLITLLGHYLLHDNRINIAVFSLTILSTFFILRKIIFPTTVTTIKS